MYTYFKFGPGYILITEAIKATSFRYFALTKLYKIKYKQRTIPVQICISELHIRAHFFRSLLELFLLGQFRNSDSETMLPRKQTSEEVATKYEI